MGDFTEFENRFKAMVASYQKQYPNLSVDFDTEFKRYRDYAQRLRELDLTRDTVSYLSKKLAAGDHVLVEGANGTMLDIDFGTYPYVTSSNCTIGGVLTGLGIAPHHIGDVIGIVKAYATRVGGGFFPTEQKNEIGETLVRVGKEFGVTTGRKRRCGWLDMVLLRYSNMINGFTKIALTKLDILDQFEEIKIGVSYTLNGHNIDYVPACHSELEKVVVEYITLPGWKADTSGAREFSELPKNAQDYVLKLQELLQVPIAWIGVGKARASLIHVPLDAGEQK
jgi:adenylosuccinate synthase